MYDPDPRALPLIGRSELLDLGEAAPWFQAAALSGNPRYVFDSAAGRPLLMLFMGSGRWEPSAAALALVARHRTLFNDSRASFFGVTIDPDDAAQGRIAQLIPGVRWFLDYDARVSRSYGAARGRAGEQVGYVPHWLLLDMTLRVVARAPITEGERMFAALIDMIERGPEQTQAPILTVPRVFEPELCRHLIALYEQNGGRESGFMRQEGAKTIGKLDPSFKRRSDFDITDGRLREALLDRMRRRLVPQIQRAFHFQATRIERWIVACYDSETGGFFRPHRDNTTAATAHRAFACTINLNAEGFEGGELCFPEYGPRTYRAPTGGAVVFSCSLLHEATAVSAGRRYAFLPFFYDEAGAQLRERNQNALERGDDDYRAGEARAGTALPVQQP